MKTKFFILGILPLAICSSHSAFAACYGEARILKGSVMRSVKSCEISMTSDISSSGPGFAPQPGAITVQTTLAVRASELTLSGCFQDQRSESVRADELKAAPGFMNQDGSFNVTLRSDFLYQHDFSHGSQDGVVNANVAESYLRQFKAACAQLKTAPPRQQADLQLTSLGIGAALVVQTSSPLILPQAKRAPYGSKDGSVR